MESGDRGPDIRRMLLIGSLIGLLAVLAAWRFRAPVARAPESSTPELGDMGSSSSTLEAAVTPTSPESTAAPPGTPPVSPGIDPNAAALAPERLKVEVVASYPHDPKAFTQGLLWSDGVLYESTGLNGQSSLRRVDLQTGKVDESVTVPPQFFAEGLALVGDQLFQLTWQSHVGFIYDAESLAQEGGFTYLSEGWGLCHDGRRLIMSDGTDQLSFRSVPDFAETGRVSVTAAGVPESQLNELECVGDLVYANVWQTDRILRIDAKSGSVTGEIDASGLLTESERAGADVLNGIAFDPEGQRFFVTGKLWPKLFEVRFVPN